MAFQGDSIYWVEVEKVVPNPFQPRREFDQNKLQELADSIRMYGVLQPLTVTRSEVQREDGTFYTEYELIAGERRLRASKLAGTAQVPVIIREGEQSEQEKLELAIIENLQREDLNAVDRAIAFKQLAEMFGLSHAQVAEKVQRSREYVSNSIRLLGLPENILEALKFGKMSEGHARTLLMLNDRPEEQDVIFREILLKKMSVREVERIVRKIATDKVRKKSAGDLDSNLIEYEKQFTETLGTRVQIQKTDFGGKLTIDYFSVEDLEGMLERMKKEAQELVPQQEEVHKLTEHTPLEQVSPESTLSPRAAVRAEYPAAVVAPTPTPTPTPAPAPTPTPAPTPAPAPNPIPAPELKSEELASAQSEAVRIEPAQAPAAPQQPKYPWMPTRRTQESPVDEPGSFARQTPQTEQSQAVSEVASVDSVAQEAESVPSLPVEQNEPSVPENTAPHHQPFASRYVPQSFQNNQPNPIVTTEENKAVEPAPTQPYDVNRNREVSLAPKDTPAPVKPDEDDSSLYSMTNFNV